MITLEQYIQLVRKAHIDAQEKEYISEILALVEKVEDLPSDLLLRMEEILTEEQNLLVQERERLIQEQAEAKVTLDQKKSELPGKIEQMDQEALTQIAQLEKESSEKMEQIDKEEAAAAEGQKKKLEDQRYQEILNTLKKRK